MLAFFSATLCSFFPPFCLYSPMTSALLRGYMSDQFKKKMLFFLHPNKHKDFNMYRSHRWTMADLRGHNRVALWSSSVKVYALSHMGKEPCDLILLSSMIMLLVVDVSHWFHRLSCRINTGTQIKKWCVNVHWPKQVSFTLHHFIN